MTGSLGNRGLKGSSAHEKKSRSNLARIGRRLFLPKKRDEKGIVARKGEKKNELEGKEQTTWGQKNGSSTIIVPSTGKTP